MFKKKLFLYGLGAGIIVGTLLLQLMWMADFGDKADQATVENSVFQSQQNFKAEADRLGFVIFPKTEQVYTEQEVDEKITEAVNEAIKDVEAANQSESLPEAIIQKSFYITKGSNSEEVAELLLQLGLIHDKKVFIDDMVEKGLASRIQTGVFLFEGEPDMSEIEQLITTPR